MRTGKQTHIHTQYAYDRGRNRERHGETCREGVAVIEVVSFQLTGTMEI